MPKRKQTEIETPFVSAISSVLLKLLVESNTDVAPDPYSTSFYDWEYRMKIQTDLLANELVELFDKRYRLKD